MAPAKQEASGWSQHLAGLGMLGIAATFTIIIGFVGNIRGDLSAMQSRFEERTLAADRELTLIKQELTRARNSRAILREIKSKQDRSLKYMDKEITSLRDQVRVLEMSIAQAHRDFSNSDVIIKERVSQLEIMINRVFDIMKNQLRIDVIGEADVAKPVRPD